METILQKIEKALPQLEAKIKEACGVEMKSHVEVCTDYMGEEYYHIYSDDLSGQLCNLSATLFKSIRFTMRSGSGVETMARFAPRLEYEHHDGNTNEVEFVWRNIHFDIENGEWIFSKSLIQKS